MMNGTVAPVWVVVVAMSEGCAPFGSYDWNVPVTEDLYSYAYVVGALHCGSLEPFVHSHGCTCGPDRTGPPIGWLTIVTAPVRCPAMAALSTAGPLGSPVSSPSYE